MPGRGGTSHSVQIPLLEGPSEFEGLPPGDPKEGQKGEELICGDKGV